MTTPMLRGLRADVADAYAYDLLPGMGYGPRVAVDWQVLATECRAQFADLTANRLTWLHVTDDPEPYATAAAMHRHVARGMFAVSRANSDHPVWTVGANIAFRAAHDVLGHCDARSGFDWIGELEACATHGAHLSIAARRALFVECIMQTGTAIERGAFPVQKIGDPFPYMSDRLRVAYSAWLLDPRRF